MEFGLSSSSLWAACDCLACSGPSFSVTPPLEPRQALPGATSGPQRASCKHTAIQEKLQVGYPFPWPIPERRDDTQPAFHSIWPRRVNGRKPVQQACRLPANLRHQVGPLLAQDLQSPFPTPGHPLTMAWATSFRSVSGKGRSPRLFRVCNVSDGVDCKQHVSVCVAHRVLLSSLAPPALVAGSLGLLAACTRSAGVLLMMPFAVEYFESVYGALAAGARRHAGCGTYPGWPGALYGLLPGTRW